jgi:hypothetical protein
MGYFIVKIYHYITASVKEKMSNSAEKVGFGGRVQGLVGGVRSTIFRADIEKMDSRSGSGMTDGMKEES